MPFLPLVNDLHRDHHGECAPLVLLVLSVMFDTISQRVLLDCLQRLSVFFMVVLLLLKWAILAINHRSSACVFNQSHAGGCAAGFGTLCCAI